MLASGVLHSFDLHFRIAGSPGEGRTRHTVLEGSGRLRDAHRRRRRNALHVRKRQQVSWSDAGEESRGGNALVLLLNAKASKTKTANWRSRLGAFPAKQWSLERILIHRNHSWDSGMPHKYHGELDHNSTRAAVFKPFHPANLTSFVFSNSSVRCMVYALNMSRVTLGLLPCFTFSVFGLFLKPIGVMCHLGDGTKRKSRYSFAGYVKTQIPVRSDVSVSLTAPKRTTPTICFRTRTRHLFCAHSVMILERTLQIGLCVSNTNHEVIWAPFIRGLANA